MSFYYAAWVGAYHGVPLLFVRPEFKLTVEAHWYCYGRPALDVLCWMGQ